MIVLYLDIHEIVFKLNYDNVYSFTDNKYLSYGVVIYGEGFI